MKNLLLAILAISIFTFSNCTAPRSITVSGKVTPKKNMKIGYDLSGNISTQTVKSVYSGLETVANKLINKDSIILDDELIDVNEALMAYTLDPISTGFDVYMRYGLFKRMDIGYKFASGTHCFDAMYQFMGSTGTFDEPGESGMHGSIGVQYSSQNFKIFDFPGIDKAQEILGFKFKRKTLLIPLVFSGSFGPEEKYGCFSFGMVYNYNKVEYWINPTHIYKLTDQQFKLPKPIYEEKNYGNLGGFINIKAGYQFIYLVASLSIYRQTYGTYELIDESTRNFKGMTFIPTIGLQTVFPLYKRKKKDS